MYHIIYNPVAGKKKSRKNLRIVENILQQRGIAYELHQSCAVHDAEAIARRLTEAGETELIVLGGDGTLHEVLNGIVDPTICKLGLIPSGTGNDFAERRGISLDPAKALERILNGEATPVDYIDVSGTRCMNIAGLGIDVDVLERCQRGKLKGKLKYLISLIKSLFAFKGYRVKVVSEGREETHEVLICAACNGSQFGGGIKICPPAREDDGKLDVIVVGFIKGKWKIVKAFIQLMKGRVIEYVLTTYFRCDSVTFLPEKACPIQLDGEVYHNHAFEAKLCTGLKFY
ncbi:MAG: diacylglycerol kinase family lipid kinase [Clostridiales bacterium]|nr:diacylglycerol kinase family lipid kinase [Clostridiales bacterium]